VTVHTIVGELVGHDPPCSIANQYVNSIGAFRNLVGSCFDRMPVGDVTLQPGDFLRYFLTHFLANGFQSIIHHVLGHGKDVDMLDVLLEKRVGASITDACDDLALTPRFEFKQHTLGASSYDSYLARLVWNLLEAELLVLGNEAMAGTSEVLCDGALDGIDERSHGCLLYPNLDTW